MKGINMLRGLYVISDDTLTPEHSMLAQIEQTLKAGAKIVQYRDKVSTNEKKAKNAHKIQHLCWEYGALFVLNDAYSLAINEGFDGLHVGKSDYDKIEQIRKSYKGILGISCYGDIAQAQKMQEIGADYVAFGSFFASPTKPNSAVVPLEVLREAKEKLDIPVCAIGGINRENIDQIMAQSPDMAAIISDIWRAKDIEEQAKYFVQHFAK